MKNHGYTYTDQISASDEGRSVIEYYTRHYRHSSAETWQARILAGQVKMNGRFPYPDDLLGPGDTLEYLRPPWEEPEVSTAFSILHEDGDLAVLAKPSGLPVLPAGGFLENTLLNLARKRFGDACSPLHRLGRGTSGAILFTRNAAAAKFLGHAMEELRIAKTYLALASGVHMPERFSVNVPIGPVPYPPTQSVHAYAPEGKSALSHFRVIHRFHAENASLLEARIVTGRPHQIRIHLSHAGFPLRGDPLYAGGSVPVADIAGKTRLPRPGDCGYTLHAWKIRFPHPGSGDEMEVTAPPPPGLDPDHPAPGFNGSET